MYKELKFAILTIVGTAIVALFSIPTMTTNNQALANRKVLSLKVDLLRSFAIYPPSMAFISSNGCFINYLIS